MRRRPAVTLFVKPIKPLPCKATDMSARFEEGGCMEFPSLVTCERKKMHRPDDLVSLERPEHRFFFDELQLLRP